MVRRRRRQLHHWRHGFPADAAPYHPGRGGSLRHYYDLHRVLDVARLAGALEWVCHLEEAVGARTDAELLRHPDLGDAPPRYLGGGGAGCRRPAGEDLYGRLAQADRPVTETLERWGGERPRPTSSLTPGRGIQRCFYRPMPSGCVTARSRAKLPTG